MTQKVCLLQDLAGSTLLQTLHALSKRPKTSLQLCAHGPLGEAELFGDLPGAQPLLEAHCYSNPILAW